MRTFTFCEKLRYTDVQRLARDTPTHASCTSSSPHPSSLSPLISGAAEEVFQQTTPAALCFDSGCMSGLFPVAAWTQDASQRGGVVGGMKKKEKKRKSRSHDSRVLRHCAGVLSNSGRNLPQVYKKGQTENINLPVNPGALFFHWTQWSIALFDHNGHKKPLMFEDINPCHDVCRQPSQQIFVVVGPSRFLNMWFYLTLFFFLTAFFFHILILCKMPCLQESWISFAKKRKE